MNAFARTFHLPLLGKELTESAARPRTYWTRVVYGTLLFLILGLGQGQFFRGGSNPLGVLGEGKELFETLVGLQFGGIFLFLPALMAGRITQEKERDSLVLLFLTELTPWGIVLQKYLAGLVPMLSFLLLGLPLGAVAYAFGGFPAHDLALAALMLGLGCVQVGAIAIWCSAVFRSTVGAFLGTYIIGLALYGGPVLIAELLQEMKILGRFGGEIFLRHFPPAAFEFVRGNGGLPARWGEFWKCVAAILGTTFFFLALAPWRLRRRAAAPRARRMQRLFAALDRFAERANRLVGGVRITRLAPALAEREPILWRERRSRMLRDPAHLIRILLAIEVPVMALAAFLARSPSIFQEQAGLSATAAILGTVGVLVITATAANVFVSERVSQTLEVLLTTPLPAREIVRQKARALHGLVIIVAVPLLSLFVYEAVLENIGPAHPVFAQRLASEPPWLYLTCVGLTLLICLPLVMWLSIWIGLAAKTRLRAIMTSLAVVVGWCVLPLLILGPFLELNPSRGTNEGLFFLTSPLTVPAANEFHHLHEMMKGAPWVPVLVNFTGYGMILFFIRNYCLKNADRYLRR